MTRVAAIDCGTNSTRLLVLGNRGEQLARELRTTRLGQGVGATRTLSPQAIDRTVEALAEYRVLLERHRVELVRAVATSAARDAANVEEFFDRAESVLGARPEMITGEEEGRLTYAGATALLPPRSYCVVDIGGGSTELVVGKGDDVLEVRSVDIGSVRLTEAAFRNDPYQPEEIEQATSVARRMLSGMHLDVREAALIAVAGTATALGAVDLGLSTYDPDRINGHEMSTERVKSLVDLLSAMPLTARRTRVLPPERAEIIVAGAVVLSSVMTTFGFTSCRLSEADILDGIAAALRMSAMGRATMVDVGLRSEGSDESG